MSSLWRDLYIQSLLYTGLALELRGERSYHSPARAALASLFSFSERPVRWKSYSMSLIETLSPRMSTSTLLVGAISRVCCAVLSWATRFLGLIAAKQGVDYGGYSAGHHAGLI